MINYSKTIVFYDIYIRYMVPYITDPANVTRFGLTPTFVSDLNGHSASWGIDIPKYLDPKTYGRLTTATANADYKSFKAFNDGMKQTLKNNPSIVLTEEDYLTLDIHKDSNRRTEAHTPGFTPGVLLQYTSELNNRYIVIDLANPRSGAKPPKVTRIKVKMLVQDASRTAPTIDMLVAEMEVGSMDFDIPFTEDQVGKIAYIAVCFSNDAGDSVYSPIIASMII